MPWTGRITRWELNGVSFGLEVFDLGVSDIWKWIILDGWLAHGRTGLMTWVNENRARWFVMCRFVVVLLLGEEIHFRLMVINFGK